MREEPKKPGALILDSQGLSKLIDGDPQFTLWHQTAQERVSGTVISSVTLVEAQHSRMQQSRVDYILSGLQVIPPELDIVKKARSLLSDVGKHGHRHALDAIVAATALAQPGPVILVTSDPDDMAALCDKRVLIQKI